MKLSICAALLLAICFLSPQEAKATDYAYGYTSLNIDSAAGVVRGYHRTEVDYNTDVYYSPYVCGSLSKNGIEVQRRCYSGIIAATTTTQTTYSVTATYAALSDHYVNIEYYEEAEYGSYNYYDVFGISFAPITTNPFENPYPAPAIYTNTYSKSIRLGDTYVDASSLPRIISVSQRIIDRANCSGCTGEPEVAECGRFEVTVKYEVGCPPPGHEVDLTGLIKEDAIYLGEQDNLINNDNNEVCTYENVRQYQMKNRLGTGATTGNTRYTALVAWSERRPAKRNMPGIAVRNTIFGTGPCP